MRTFCAREFDGQESAKRLVGPGDKGILQSTCGINLPSGYNMTEDLADTVCCACRDIFDALIAGRAKHK
jgi:perosamine synthetase